jgi:hypothetical protein
MRLSDCECCSPCNPDDEAIKLSGCWYFINTEEAMLDWGIFDEYLKL